MMSARQAASLALIAFGLSELFLRGGGTAKSIKTTATDQGTTLLILGSYGAVIAMLCLRSLLGAALPSSWNWVGGRWPCWGVSTHGPLSQPVISRWSSAARKEWFAIRTSLFLV